MHNFFNQINTVDGLNSGLNESSSLSIESELINKLLEMIDLVLLSFSLSFSLLDLFSLGFLELIEVSLIISELLVLEFNNFVYDLIKEVSCVRDDNDGNVKRLDVIFEPNKSNEIQMIGRLIEQ